LTTQSKVKKKHKTNFARWYILDKSLQNNSFEQAEVTSAHLIGIENVEICRVGEFQERLTGHISR
jgi:hypothetical protein